MKKKIIEANRKPRKCETCGSKKIASILYGMPAMNEQLQKEIKAGKIVIGGCVILNDNPQWECADCHQKYRRKKTL